MTPSRRDFWSQIRTLECPVCRSPMNQERHRKGELVVRWRCKGECGARFVLTNPVDTVVNLRTPRAAK